MRSIRLFLKRRFSLPPPLFPLGSWRMPPPEPRNSSDEPLVRRMVAGLAIIALLFGVLSLERARTPRQGVLTAKGWSCETILEKIDPEFIPVTKKDGSSPVLIGLFPLPVGGEEIARFSTSSTTGPAVCQKLQRPLKQDEQIRNVLSSYIVLRDDGGTYWQRTFSSADDNAAFMEGERYEIDLAAKPR